MTFEIEKIEYALGEIAIPVSRICDDNGKNYERLIKRSGFEYVHRTLESENQFFSDFLSRNLSLASGDYLIFINQSMTGRIPGKVSEVFKSIANATEVAFLELSDGCSGFARGLITANALIHSGSTSRVHIVCAEKYSKMYNNMDESVSPIFSDAISAITVRQGRSAKLVSMEFQNYFAQSSRISSTINSDGIEKFGMDGAHVLSWAANEVPRLVNQLLEKAGLAVQDISTWFMHQGSKIVVDSIMQKLGVEGFDSFTAGQIGNTGSSSIPIMMKMYSEHYGAYLPEGFSVVCGFGIGLTLVIALLEVSY
jgi:3-oxoacyl-[acyl-carrier-protein] synthase III